MTLRDLITHYQAHLAKGSPHSLQAFLPLATAVAALADRPATEITGAEWRAWFTEHCGQLSAGTRALRFRHLRALYGYPARWLGLADFPNPFRNGGWKKVVPTPPPPYRPILTEEQIAGICAAPKTRRTKLLTRLMAERGLRLGEALRIVAGDFRDHIAGSGDRRVLLLPRTKAGLQQVVVLPEQLATDLKAYCEEKGLIGEARVFPINPTSARNIVKRAAKRLGLNLTPHDLRRALASRLDRKGVDPGLIQATLRHSSRRVTEEHYIAPRTLEEMGELE